MASTGDVNWIYGIAEVAVLRVAGRGHPDWVNDARTESVAVPAFRAAEVRTPALLAFDGSRDIVDVPDTIYERVAGVDLSTFGAADHIHREVGRDLATLHRETAPISYDRSAARIDVSQRSRRASFSVNSAEDSSG